ncbi:hypothetical protein CKO38_14325 [Rhodospirillum rubrum]|uniref:hypothetical protein n=1 Tax=Rhodospirillum rubrum TaxID=1085 RepID=UPI0019054552|nr:hypothetical protein [Rhodospirillum rubrum]MBK1665701.1 hypothetical protein [Rhodospirillum rubrum]MBK1677823.1 hypothetical protein [Rhodospirillum rubrum]
MVTAKLLGILVVAVAGLAFYLSIYVVGSTIAMPFMTIMLFVGLALTVLLMVLIVAMTAAKNIE